MAEAEENKIYYTDSEAIGTQLSNLTTVVNNIGEQVATLTSTKESIKSALQEQGVEVSDLDPFSTYGDKIASIISSVYYDSAKKLVMYEDENGIEHEIGELGGIAPMPVQHRDIVKTGTGYNIRWTDPADSVYQDNVYCTWGGTLIVRKEGEYPTSPYDGEIVVDNKVRDAYAKEPLVDTVSNTSVDYKYRAFPYSTNRVFNMNTSNKFGSWLYGYVECDVESDVDKRVEYLEENEHYNKCFMNFTSDKYDWGSWENVPFLQYENCAPVMLYNTNAGEDLAGTVMEYLDPNNHDLTLSGEPSHVRDDACNANAMVQIKAIFTKVVVNGDYEYVYFSNEKLDDDFECLSCKRADGTYNEYFYVPMFNGSSVDNTLRSLAGKTPISSQNGTTEITQARNNGDGWDTEVWVDAVLFERLFTLLHKTTQSQVALGQGKSNGGSSVADCLQTGTMITKGMMYGSSSTAVGVKFMYVENYYGSQWRRFRGLIVANGVTKVKMTKSTIDGSTATDYNTDGSGYITLDVPAPTGTSGGYVSATKTYPLYGRFATVVSGSSTTNIPDGRWWNVSLVGYPYRGGSSYHGALCGAFTLASNYAVSAASWDIGASLSYKKP